jgi:hypothetical protein
MGILAGVVAAGVLTGAGVAVAATSSPGHPVAGTSASPSPSASPSQALPWRMFHMHGKMPFPFGAGPGFLGPGFLGPGFLGGLGGAVHGTVVVPKSGGGYQTIDFQNGTVTAVSTSSITLHSADGYSHTYQVTSSTMVNAERDGIGSIKNGNTVSVQATVSGGTTTAIRITDVSLLQQGLKSFFGTTPGASVKMAIP